MRKVVIIIIALVVLLGGAIALFAMKGRSSKSAASPTPKPKLSLPENVIPVSERPYVTLQPTTGREVMIEIGEVKKKAESVDFELEYSAGDKEEAAIGSMNIAGSPPYKKTILLGSQSGGGKVTYHSGVTGGRLALTFYDENYKLSNEWSYIDNTKPKTGFSSRDAKFQLDSAKLLNSSPYVIVYNNPGLPAEVKGNLLAGPYSVSTIGALPQGKVNLIMRLSEEKPATIMGWTGSEWKSFTTTTDGKSATTSVDLLATYVAVEK